MAGIAAASNSCNNMMEHVIMEVLYFFVCGELRDDSGVRKERFLS